MKDLACGSLWGSPNSPRLPVELTPLTMSWHFSGGFQTTKMLKIIGLVLCLLLHSCPASAHGGHGMKNFIIVYIFEQLSANWNFSGGEDDDDDVEISGGTEEKQIEPEDTELSKGKQGDSGASR